MGWNSTTLGLRTFLRPVKCAGRGPLRGLVMIPSNKKLCNYSMQKALVDRTN
jgi:hypothetical protein